MLTLPLVSKAHFKLHDIAVYTIAISLVSCLGKVHGMTPVNTVIVHIIGVQIVWSSSALFILPPCRL